MKSWHAGLIWFFILGTLILTFYRAPESGKPLDPVFASNATNNMAFHEDVMEIVVSFRSGDTPLQVELIKRYGENPPRAILRTRIIESEPSRDLHRFVDNFVGHDYELGESGYVLRLNGSPMSNYFQSIIVGHGSYDCILIGMDWTIDRENQIIMVKGNPVIQNLASQNQQ